MTKCRLELWKEPRRGHNQQVERVCVHGERGREADVFEHLGRG